MPTLTGSLPGSPANAPTSLAIIEDFLSVNGWTRIDTGYTSQIWQHDLTGIVVAWSSQSTNLFPNVGEGWNLATHQLVKPVRHGSSNALDASGYLPDSPVSNSVTNSLFAMGVSATAGYVLITSPTYHAFIIEGAGFVIDTYTPFSPSVGGLSVLGSTSGGPSDIYKHWTSRQPNISAPATATTVSPAAVNNNLAAFSTSSVDAISGLRFISPCPKFPYFSNGLVAGVTGATPIGLYDHLKTVYLNGAVLAGDTVVDGDDTYYVLPTYGNGWNVIVPEAA